MLLARRSVQLVVAAARTKGVDYIDGRARRISEARSAGSLAAIDLGDGRTLRAARFVFACGPWLATLFPTLLGPRIVPTRQEVFYVGPPSGDGRFAAAGDAGVD